MPKDPDLLSCEIDRLALCCQNLVAIARSLLAEVSDLKEASQVALDAGEEWPRFTALPLYEMAVFMDWLTDCNLPHPPNREDCYFPWHYARWKFETR